MRPIPDLSREAPTNVSYRDYAELGLPFVNPHQEHFTSRQLHAETVTAVRSGFGNFDTAQPEQQHFDRKLYEILTKAGTGEFRIIIMQTQWISCEKFGVRVMRYVEWLEYSRRTAPEMSVVSRSDFLHRLSDSR